MQAVTVGAKATVGKITGLAVVAVGLQCREILQSSSHDGEMGWRDASGVRWLSQMFVAPKSTVETKSRRADRRTGEIEKRYLHPRLHDPPGGH